MSVRVENLERLRAKIDRMSVRARAEMKAANDKSLGEFVGQVRRIIPTSAEAPHLAGSIRTGPGRHELEAEASVGDANVPYPAHLEWGHIAPDGTRVPGKPFWFPALRIMRKRFKGRASRAAKKAVSAT